MLMKILWGYILLLYGYAFVVAIQHGHYQLARITFLVPFLTICFLAYVWTHLAPYRSSRLRAKEDG